MALPEPHCFFVEPLERAGLTYCVTGSLAAGLYGEPRLTEAFSPNKFYVPPGETILEEI